MRCLACNRNLSLFEDDRKYADRDERIQLCTGCLHTTEIKYEEDVLKPDVNFEDDSIEEENEDETDENF